MPRPHLVLRAPEAELLRPAHWLEPSAAQREEAARSRRDHAKLTQVGESADHRRAALVHEAPSRAWTDAGDAEELLVSAGRHVHGKVLPVSERPRGLRVHRERQIACLLVD